MKILIIVLICLGSALMVHNIGRYYIFLKHIQKMESLGETRKTAVFPLVLLVCFLVGYLTVGFLGNPDIVVALILFGGSIYVSLVLMFLYRIVDQLEQNEIRLNTLYTELRNDLKALTKDSLSVLRVNLTKDIVEERGGFDLFESDRTAQSYSELISSRRAYLLKDIKEEESRLFTRDGLIAHYKNGHTTAEEVVFCRRSTKQACFVLLKATLATQPVTGDIVAFITEIMYNDEIVDQALMNKALAGQYDMIAYLVDGRCGVVIGDYASGKKGNIFPDRNDDSFRSYIQKKIGPVLFGTQEEKDAALFALSSNEIERRLEEREPYEVNIACTLEGEIYYKRFVFYKVDPNAKFYILLKSDTTDARREEMERSKRLEEALEEARRASTAKTTFLSNMSHDIRTPMNAIIGYINLAKKEGTAPEQIRDYLDKIDSSSQYLLALINDVLEMSRIESGKLELESVPVDLRGLLGEVRDMFATQMKEKGITFEVSDAGLYDKVVLCDENRFNRVLLNLLSNAYKFTPENGSISVVMRQLDYKQKGFGEYELRVKDSGIGMTAEFAEHVFDAFERERTSTVSGIQGTGLGMAITKNIVDLMGGSIEVKTEQGKGTEFIIRLSLPIREDTEGTAEGEAAAAEEEGFDFTSVHALLVEDLEVNREIASFMLREMGLKIDTAENGKDAVEMVEASEPGFYDLILMDIQMPVMNGYEAAKKIRSLEDPALAGIPIVAMTANAFNEDVKEAKKAGMNDHISKPLDADQIQKTLKKVLVGNEKESSRV